ncbi:glucose-6-phosphate dehydrogenase, partial [Patescibacteria group bacterium]|nr:glucose-6-phosphate dehydrogenase [Patescibacteria group bacterium]
MKNTHIADNLLPTIFVIFGATGDLTRQKLVPALFHLYREGLLPSLFQVIGFAFDDLSDEEFRERVRDIVRKKVPGAREKKINEFCQYFLYRKGRFENIDGYKELAQALGQSDGEWKVCSNKLFYLAIPPQYYKTIFHKLAESKLTKPCSPEEGWTRVIVEKPFGKNLKTAQELDKLLGSLFHEEQIYRIDHYLGKETVQNILAFRFSNSFLDPAWNSKWIESISIRLLEQDGIGKRGAFYDGIGALRDVGQNHMLQLLALFLMEPPTSFEGDAVRKARAEVLYTLDIPKGKKILSTAVRGQYKGYLKEPNVAANSKTETYFHISTSLNNKRWRGMPLILESGKGLKKDLVEVQIIFRHPTPCLCPEANNFKHYKNVLYYTIQP